MAVSILFKTYKCASYSLPLLEEMIQFDKYVWGEDPYECNLLNECVSISFAVANSCQSVNCVSRIIQQGLLSFLGVLHLFAYLHALLPIPTLPVKKKDIQQAMTAMRRILLCHTGF